MQPQATALTLLFALSASPLALAHSDRVMEACPNLKDGAVPTTIIPSDISFDTSDSYITQITGEIETNMATNIRNELLITNRAETTPLPTVILIDSPGGSVTSAHSIIDSMNLNGNTAIVCANKAASAGLTVLAAAQNGYALESCNALIHGSTHNFSGSLKTIQEQLNLYARLETRDRAILTDSPLLDDTCYETLSENGDIYLTATELLHLGLVDAILLPQDQMTVRADDLRVAFNKCLDEYYATPGNKNPNSEEGALKACPVEMLQTPAR